MFATLLIITLFLLASLLVCLLTLKIFHSLPILMDILKFQPPLYFEPPSPFIRFKKDLQPLVYFQLGSYT